MTMYYKRLAGLTAMVILAAPAILATTLTGCMGGGDDDDDSNNAAGDGTAWMECTCQCGLDYTNCPGDTSECGDILGNCGEDCDSRYSMPDSTTPWNEYRFSHDCGFLSN